jgi:hypothetical protein
MEEACGRRQRKAACRTPVIGKEADTMKEAVRMEGR